MEKHLKKLIEKEGMDDDTINKIVSNSKYGAYGTKDNNYTTNMKKENSKEIDIIFDKMKVIEMPATPDNIIKACDLAKHFLGEETTKKILGDVLEKTIKDLKADMKQKGSDYDIDKKEGKETPYKSSSGNYKLKDNVADMINHPPHYTGSVECIDAMESAFGIVDTARYCHINAFKYLWRSKKKNGIEDIKKAIWYLNKYVELQEKQ